MAFWQRRFEKGWAGRWLLEIAALFLISLTPFSLWAADDENLHLWHSYRGEERQALDKLLRQWNALHPEQKATMLAVPHDAYANKLTSAIPRGHGPDLFIAAHERIGDWARSGLLKAIDTDDLPQSELDTFFPRTVEALRYEDRLYGLPLAFKSAAMFVNPRLLGDKAVPENTADLLEFCERFKSRYPDKFCLAYEAGSFYHHAAWLYGFGGAIFNANGQFEVDRDQNARSYAFVKKLTQLGYVPEEPGAALVTQLFNDGRAAMAINGPWMMGEIEETHAYEIHPLPLVSQTGRPAEPFLTVEGLLFSARSTHQEKALRLARFLAGEAGSAVRAEFGHQAVAHAPLYSDGKTVIDSKIIRFKEQVANTRPMPNTPLMRAVWEPMAQALRKVLRGAASPEDALAKAQHQLKVISRPAPEKANPLVYLLVLTLLVIVGGILLFRRLTRSETLGEMRNNLTAYGYIAPAALAMVLLVFLPFVVGTAVSLFSHRAGEFTFVGLANFWNILSCADYEIGDPLSFYFTLLVTVLWTAINVFLHVSIGLCLALLLRDPWMRLRGVYRVLLIVPWAVPNYITALIWKSMFHKQFGAVNGLLIWLGLEPVSWFSHFWTAFAANLSTNTWLGFPFMMVVTLGALQAIPRDLEEAAEVDGAGRFARFFSITLPLLRPALLPAVILGSVWTFNMFNIIFLVSGGEPDGATEILISEAYRWAFTRQEQYGYAAAYATLIFGVLLIYSWGTRRLMKEA